MHPKLVRRIAELDAALPALAKPIRVLKYLTWPNALEERFLADWRAGRPALPRAEHAVPDWTFEIAALDAFAGRAAGADPILQYLRRTALSYAEAGRMLMAAGTPAFTEHSITLYGRPDDVYRTQSFNGVEAAAFLLEKSDNLIQGNYIAPTRPEMTAGEFASRLQQAIDAYFVDDKVEVRIDDALSAIAIAGTTRIRIRASALFSDLDFDQLFQHEALIHTATAINGRRQPNLKSMALGAPRTTRTQEGIAVFAELVTRSIDISRLRRLAVRIQALKRALDGADFIEVFKTFLETGQDEQEAYKSAQRIFRGGDVRGGVAFTKDSAYLKGLMEMARAAGRPHQYLTAPTRKEELARQMAERDGISEGLVCVFSVLEPCRTFSLVWKEAHPYVRPAWRKCLQLYFYFLDPHLGLIHVKLQTWFPFPLLVYVNGHEWLARRLDRHGILYRKRDNVFVHVRDLERAQKLADGFASVDWVRVLGRYARRVNPLLRDLLAPMQYYWVTAQAEYATDVLFRSHQALEELMPRLLTYSTL